MSHEVFLKDEEKLVQKDDNAISLQEVPENLRWEDFENMTFSDMETQPMGSPIEVALQENALAYLRMRDRKWFFREFSGEVDSTGYLLRKNGQMSNIKPSQCVTGGIPEVRTMTRDFLRAKYPKESNLQSENASNGAEMRKSQERKVFAESPAIVKEPVADPDFIFDELRHQISERDAVHTKDSLEESPIFDSRSVGDVERGIDSGDVSEELSWASVDAIVGRSGADVQEGGWAHEYSGRKGLIENVAQSIRDGEEDKLEQAFHVRRGKAHRVQLVALDGPSGSMYCVKDGTHRVAGSKLAGLREIPVMVRRPKFPLVFSGYDKDQARDIQRKIKLGFMKGSVKTEMRSGKEFFICTIEKEILPWLHIKEGVNTKVARAYERLYPGSLDHIVLSNGKEMPRDALVDDIALDYFVAGRWQEWVQNFSQKNRNKFGVVQY